MVGLPKRIRDVVDDAHNSVVTAAVIGVAALIVAAVALLVAVTR